MRVAIIGAGASGLCTARYVASQKGWPAPVVYEASADLGGIWSPDEQQGLVGRGVLYNTLKTNLPIEIMGFPHFPFPSGDQSFVHHSEVKAYLQRYAQHFDLIKYIKFGHAVKHVERCSDDKSWLVSSTERSTNSPLNAEYDALFVCNGHYFEHHFPSVSGQADFPGELSHSASYRTCEPYAGKTVAVMGSGASGMDLVVELGRVAKKVYWCHRGSPFNCSLPGDVQQIPAITAFTDDGRARLKNGEVTDALDAVIFCTGYRYSFPFFDANLLAVDPGGQRIVTPLYQHMIHIDYPSSLFLIGIPKTVLPFPLFDTQVRLAMQILNQQCHLPSRSSMLESHRHDMTHRSSVLQLSPDDAHYFGPLQWGYHRELAALGNFSLTMPRYVESLYGDAHALRRTLLSTYKTMHVKFDESGNARYEE